LFAEFQTEQPILIAMQYADRTTDQLEVRGFRDRRRFGGKNSYFEECCGGSRHWSPVKRLRHITDRISGSR
jgi:hypothetical protein